VNTATLILAAGLISGPLEPGPDRTIACIPDRFSEAFANLSVADIRMNYKQCFVTHSWEPLREPGAENDACNAPRVGYDWRKPPPALYVAELQAYALCLEAFLSQVDSLERYRARERLHGLDAEIEKPRR
jgi:hypothetical protein